MADISLRLRPEFEDAQRALEAIAAQSTDAARQFQALNDRMADRSADTFINRQRAMTAVMTATRGETTAVQRSVAAYQREIERLVARGLSPQSQYIRQLTGEMAQLQARQAQAGGGTSSLTEQFSKFAALGPAAVVAAVAAAAAAAVKALNEMAQAYYEAAHEENVLAAAVKNNPWMDSSSLKQLTDFKDEMELLGLEGGTVAQAMTALATQGRSAEQTMRVIRTAADMDASGIMDFSGAVDALAKTLETGEVSGSLAACNANLQGISEESAKAGLALDVMADMVGGATATRLAVGEASMIGFQKAADELREHIGKGWSEAISPIVSAAAAAMTWLNSLLSLKDNFVAAAQTKNVKSALEEYPQMLDEVEGRLRGILNMGWRSGESFQAQIEGAADSLGISSTMFGKIIQDHSALYQRLQGSRKEYVDTLAKEYVLEDTAEKRREEKRQAAVQAAADQAATDAADRVAAILKQAQDEAAAKAEAARLKAEADKAATDAENASPLHSYDNLSAAARNPLNVSDVDSLFGESEEEKQQREAAEKERVQAEKKAQDAKDERARLYRLSEITALEQHEANTERIRKEAEEKERAHQQELYNIRQAAFNAASSLIGSLGELMTDETDSKKAFEQNKAISAATAGINSALAFTQALTDPSQPILWLRIAAAAAVLTAGIVQQKKILSATYKGAAGGSAPSISVPRGGTTTTSSAQTPQQVSAGSVSGQSIVVQLDRRVLFSTVNEGLRDGLIKTEAR
jgi:hypothetical protein